VDCGGKEITYELQVKDICLREKQFQLVLLSDVTDTIQIERQNTEQIYQELLLMTVSHEMRNPLNCKFSGVFTLFIAIIQANEALDPYVDQGPDGGRQFLQVMRSSAKLLLFLVNDMLVSNRLKFLNRTYSKSNRASSSSTTPNSASLTSS